MFVKLSVVRVEIIHLHYIVSLSHDIAAIHSKDPVAILHMLVAMARYFRCPYTLPRNVRVKRILLKVIKT